MRVALVGGTGKQGRGLALRWARAGHEVRVGSRDGERGRAAAAEFGAGVAGGDNAWAVSEADVVVVCVPYAAHRATMQWLAGVLGDRVAIDVTVPLAPPKLSRVTLPEGQAAALEAQAILGADAKLVAALHHVSSVHLADVDHAIDCDVLVCGNDPDSRQQVVELAEAAGMKAWHAGQLANSVVAEALTSVLIFMNNRYGIDGAGIRVTGTPTKSG